MSANLIFINLLYPNFVPINQQHRVLHIPFSVYKQPRNPRYVQGRHWAFKLKENVAEI